MPATMTVPIATTWTQGILAALGLCSTGLMGDPLANPWPCLPSRRFPMPHRPAQRASGKHRRTRGGVGAQGLGQRLG